MRDLENDVASRSRQRVGGGKQPLVVRHSDEDAQLDEVLERLERLENLSGSSSDPPKMSARGQFRRVDAQTIVALGAILLSITGYVIQDARNTSRQDAEIEATQVRVANLEKIATANTEARIRSEVQLSELRQGQAEIKELLRTHENETRSLLHQK